MMMNSGKSMIPRLMNQMKSICNVKTRLNKKKVDFCYKPRLLTQHSQSCDYPRDSHVMWNKFSIV